MAAKKEKQGLQKLVGKRISLLDLYGEELDHGAVLILKGADSNWLEIENCTSGKAGFFNIARAGFITEHKEQP